MSAISSLFRLSPFGPIFGKELRVASRRKRNHLIRVLYLGGLLLGLLIAFTSSNYGNNQNAVYRSQQLAEMGHNFFGVFAVFCVFCMGLIAPVLTSTAISSERLGKTLNVLLMTPITAWQIVAGKLFARLLIAMLLIGLSLPVLAVVRLLGGVELSQMAAVICLCAAFALSCGAIALYFSTIMNRAYAVILLTYVTMMIIYFLAPLFLAITLLRTMNMPGIYAMLMINPVVNVIMLAFPESRLMGNNWLGLWLPDVCLQLLMTFVLLVLSAHALRRYARRSGESQGSGMIAAIVAPIENSIAVEGVIKNAPSRSVGDNPVFWREIRRPLAGGWRGRIGAIGILLLLLLSYAVFGTTTALGDEDLQIGYAFIFCGLYWLLVTVLSATVIAQEKESDTWTLLLASPMKARAIVIGKMLGLCRRMLWPTVLIVAHFAIFTLFGVVSLPIFVLILWIMITFNSVWVATGIYLSLRMRKVTTAIVVNLGLGLFVYLLMPIVAAMFDELTRSGDRLIEAIGTYIPYVYLAAGIETYCPHFDADRDTWVPLLGNHVSAGGYVAMTITVGCLFLVATAIVLQITIARFDRLVGRAPQTQPDPQN